MEHDPTSAIAVIITVGPDGKTYNVHSRRSYHPAMDPIAVDSWDRVVDGMIVQLVHDPNKLEELGILAETARKVSDITDKNRDEAFDRTSGVDTSNVVVFAPFDQ